MAGRPYLGYDLAHLFVVPDRQRGMMTHTRHRQIQYKLVKVRATCHPGPGPGLPLILFLTHNINSSREIEEMVVNYKII